MSAYLRAAEAIREAFDCLVIIVHHSGIAKDRPRGHTSLTGTVDVQLSAARDSRDNIIITVEYMKDGAEGESWASRLEVVEVGEDEDGDTVTSCVVVPVDAGAGDPKKQKQAAGAARVALDLLTRAICDAGEIPPTCNHIPGQMRCVRETLWKRYCDQGMVTESDKPDTQLKAFNRAVTRLQSLGLIGKWNEWVWVI